MAEYNTEIYQRAVDDVLTERMRQRSMWSPQHDQEHDALQWVGLMVRYQGRTVEAAIIKDEEGYRENLVKAVAVGLAALESFDHARAEAAGMPSIDADALQRERFGDDPAAEMLPRRERPDTPI